MLLIKMYMSPFKHCVIRETFVLTAYKTILGCIHYVIGENLRNAGNYIGHSITEAHTKWIA